MTLAFKYIFAIIIALLVGIFGFISPEKTTEKDIKKNELDPLFLIAKNNAIVYRKINNSIDSTNTLTDSLNHSITKSINQVNDILGFKDNFLVYEKDSIVVKVKK